MNKNTKIIATLGPASDSVTILQKMIQSGLNVARLNFSHGTYEHMTKIVKNLREACKKTGKTIAVMQDLQGPKIRLGKLPEEGVLFQKGDPLCLTAKGTFFSSKPIPTLPIQYKRLPKEVKKGDHILINDGYFEMIVDRVKGTEIYGTAMTDGILKSHKGINCPTASLTAPALSEKDKKDLSFGLKIGIDYVALSFVKSAKDIETLRSLIQKKGHPGIKIIAKIERHEAIDNLEAIAQAADGLMVARGDLGLEIPAEQVPIVQKEIVRLGLKYAKPTIIATQILESMIEHPRATRAQIRDAATDIFEHAYAFMLSADTSVGKDPLEAIQTLARVAERTEQELRKKEKLLKNHLVEEDMPIRDATCFTAAELAYDIKASVLVVLTHTGYTARQLMKHRPSIPVVTITTSKQMKRELQLVWGLNHILIQKKRIESTKEAERTIPPLLKKIGCAKKGYELVIVNATSKRERSNFITTVVV
jgi:pyruvate kinase